MTSMTGTGEGMTHRNELIRTGIAETMLRNDI